MTPIECYELAREREIMYGKMLGCTEPNPFAAARDRILRQYYGSNSQKIKISSEVRVKK